MNQFSAQSGSGQSGLTTFFLAGDVMSGRGIDQVLPHSVDSRLYERYAKTAKRYVQLAERKSGSIPAQVSYQYIWGEALEILEEKDPDARIINLETSVTTSDDYWKSKGIHYRMHPENVPLLTEADIDVCMLGNNHALDWGYDGLKESLKTLQDSGLKTAGAGMDLKSAVEPAIIEIKNRRLLVFAYASPSAGIPMTWKTEAGRPGVNLVPQINPPNAEKIAAEINQYREKGDRVVLSIHWGKNWSYEIPEAQQKFAHRLIDQEAVDVIFGHSSHHPKGMEVYNGKLILYSCGDLMNDYEGISGHEQYWPNLRLMYFPQVAGDGELKRLRMIPMQVHRFQLEYISEEGKKWLQEMLDRECDQFGHSVEQTSNGQLALRWK